MRPEALFWRIVMRNVKKLRRLTIIILLSIYLTSCATNDEDKNDDPTVEEISINVPSAEEQNETDMAFEEGKPEHVYINEELDENLFIDAELVLPAQKIYSYSTVLKSFDYEDVKNTILQESEGDIGGEKGSLVYHRNAKSGHLDFYCSYATEHGLISDDTALSGNDAVYKIKEIFDMLEVGGELEILDITVMNKDNLEAVKEIIMKDIEYADILTAKGYDGDIFEDDIEVYRIECALSEHGIPVFRNRPYLQQITDRFMAYPSTITVTISNEGFEEVVMTGMFEVYDEKGEEVNVIGEKEIKEAILRKFGDVILPVEYKAVNIWMEYFPLLTENSFLGVDLIPVWCIDFEIGGEKYDEENGYTLRINAVTGAEVS